MTSVMDGSGVMDGLGLMDADPVPTEPPTPDGWMWMYHPITHGFARVTIEAFEVVWITKGWLFFDPTTIIGNPNHDGWAAYLAVIRKTVPPDFASMFFAATGEYAFVTTLAFAQVWSPKGWILQNPP